MIYISFNPQDLTPEQEKEWEAWQREAEAATLAIIQAWEEWRDQGSLGKFPSAFDEEVWRKLKVWLLENIFNDKCAYCETREVRAPYHAEHFRPKGRVRVKGRKGLQICLVKDEYEKDVEHPGYFWLAYNWLNLLPSCNDCNTALGKNDLFPVKKEHLTVKRLSQSEIESLKQKRIKSPRHDDIYYLQPEDLNLLEEPLLLHPYLDDPAEHLVFGEFGVIAAREDINTGEPSEKGRLSIEIYNLDAERLRIARQAAQETACMEYGNELTRGRKLSIEARKKAATAAIAGVIEGKEPYSAAVLDYLRLIFPINDF